MMLGEQTLNVKTYLAGSFVAGVWTEGAETITTIRGSIQPLSERGRQQLQRLPEGWRDSVRFALFTRSTTLKALQVQGDVTADRVTWEGRDLWVASLSDYIDTAPGMTLRHHRYLLLAEEFTP